MPIQQPAAKRSRSSSPAGAAAAKRARAQPAAPAGDGGTGYRGVSCHARTRRHEAHIWMDGKQVYLGSFPTASQAALAYDIAALRHRGTKAQTNFAAACYAAALPQLAAESVDAVLAALRLAGRRPGGRQTSMFRGVCRHFKGRWEARIGASGDKRYRYLGLHDSEVEAAQAYDAAALASKGLEAATNFHLAEYWDQLAPEQQAAAAARGLVTPADLQLRQVAQAGGGSGNAAACPLASPCSFGADPGASLSPASLDFGGSAEGWAGEGLAGLLLGCILQDGRGGAPGAGSPQSVLA